MLKAIEDRIALINDSIQKTTQQVQHFTENLQNSTHQLQQLKGHLQECTHWKITFEASKNPTVTETTEYSKEQDNGGKMDQKSD